MGGIPFFLFQPNFPSPPFVKGGKKGLKDSKRSYLVRRLFQFSNLVWRIGLDDQGPKMILEKGLIEKCPNNKQQIPNKFQWAKF